VEGTIVTGSTRMRLAGARKAVGCLCDNSCDECNPLPWLFEGNDQRALQADGDAGVRGLCKLIGPMQ
jgi:hypothetical protein